MGYLPDHQEQYEHIPIHIDSTGDTVYDEIASIGIEYEDVYYVWALGNHPDAVELSDETDTVEVYTFDSDKGLLESFRGFINTLNKSETVFVGYKEEQWRGGGFNTLRTRCVRNEVPWVLEGMHYTDFGEAISGKGRFNMSVPSMSGANVAPLDDFIDMFDLDVDKSLNKAPKQNAIEAEGYTIEEVREFADATDHEVPYDDLSGLNDVHGMFSEESLLDPIESEQAVRDLVEMGNTDELIQHTVADVTRTEELFHLADEYTSRDDWETKRL